MWPQIDPNFLYNRFKIILKPAEIVCHVVTINKYLALEVCETNLTLFFNPSIKLV